MAVELRARYAAESAAQTLDTSANELEAWLASQANEVLSINEAVLRTGRKRSTIEKAVQSGRLTNLGQKGKPRVRAGELLTLYPPRVAHVGRTKYDPGADARFLLAR